MLARKLNSRGRPMLPTYSVVIVTHYSQRHLPKCLESLRAQTLTPTRIVISDNSDQPQPYLSAYRALPNVTIVENRQDLGFCTGNNIGLQYIDPSSAYVLFLNPDAFLTPTFAQQATDFLSTPGHETVGALSGILEGYNMDKNLPTGLYDSTGIFRTWYGRWYDRKQGQPVASTEYTHPEEVPALCGALMWCRLNALQSLPKPVWPDRFFMYKDDIDLSLRLRANGWKLLLHPILRAHHCRGWARTRSTIPYRYRLLSARNELYLQARNYWPGLPYSLSKYLAVRLFNL